MFDEWLKSKNPGMAGLTEDTIQKMKAAFDAGYESRSLEVEELEKDNAKCQKLIVHQVSEASRFYNDAKKYKEIIKSLLFLLSSDICSQTDSGNPIKEALINKILELNPELKP